MGESKGMRSSAAPACPRLKPTGLARSQPALHTETGLPKPCRSRGRLQDRRTSARCRSRAGTLRINAGYGSRAVSHMRGHSRLVTVGRLLPTHNGGGAYPAVAGSAHPGAQSSKLPVERACRPFTAHGIRHCPISAGSPKPKSVTAAAGITRPQAKLTPTACRSRDGTGVYSKCLWPGDAPKLAAVGHDPR